MNTVLVLRTQVLTYIAINEGFLLSSIIMILSIPFPAFIYPRITIISILDHFLGANCFISLDSYRCTSFIFLLIYRTNIDHRYY